MRESSPLFGLFFLCSDVFAVSQKGQQEKEGAQHVLAACYPSNGFDMQGVKREKRGYEGAAPGDAGGGIKIRITIKIKIGTALEIGLEEPEQQQDIGEVQEEVGSMKTTGPETEQLRIQHVGEPGQ